MTTALARDLKTLVRERANLHLQEIETRFNGIAERSGLKPEGLESCASSSTMCSAPRLTALGR